MRRLLTTAWRPVRFELRIYAALARWIGRRPAVPGGTVPFGYGRGVVPVLWLWVFASAAEIPVVRVLLPWHSPAPAGRSRRSRWTCWWTTRGRSPRPPART